MIAQMLQDAFDPFLRDPARLLPEDAVARQVHDYKSNEHQRRTHGFLEQPAWPVDPARACIVGVIDDAIPFAHELLRGPHDSSRVAAVWVQDAPRPDGDGELPGADLPWGREWRGSSIGELLRNTRGGDDAIYRAAGVLDYRRATHPSAGYEAGHGASVAMLAAGYRPDDPVGRNHPVIGVSLPPRVTEDTMGTLAPPYILAGIMFIIHRARRLCRYLETLRGLPAGSLRIPVVINISYGLTAGARDGSSLLERFMDAVSTAPQTDLGPVRFVLPTGNHRQASLVAQTLPDRAIAWRLHPGDRTISAVEIWAPPLATRPVTAQLQVGLTLPGMAEAVTAFTDDGQLQILHGPEGTEIARAYFTPRKLPGGGWREGITVIARPTLPDGSGRPVAPPGDWGLRATGLPGDARVEISVQRDETVPGYTREALQSYLFDPGYSSYLPNGTPRRADPEPPVSPIRRRFTLNAYAGGSEVLRAGATQDSDGDASDYSGWLDDGGNGDLDCAADRSAVTAGMDVRGRDSGGFRRARGTSLSAPRVTRWLAAHLAAGERPASRTEIQALAAAESTDPSRPHSLRFPHDFAEF